MSASAESIPTQLKKQANSLAKLIYLGAEHHEGRRYYLFPVDRETTFAIVLFMFEPGNRYEHWMAVFQTAEQLSSDEPTKNKFTLIAFQVIGRKSWRAANFNRPSFSYDPRQLEATIILKTTENSKDDAPNFPSKPSRAIYKLKTTFHGSVLSETRAKP